MAQGQKETHVYRQGKCCLRSCIVYDDMVFRGHTPFREIYIFVKACIICHALALIGQANFEDYHQRWRDFKLPRDYRFLT